jgi:hypothetical protein
LIGNQFHFIFIVPFVAYIIQESASGYMDVFRQSVKRDEDPVKLVALKVHVCKNNSNKNSRKLFIDRRFNVHWFPLCIDSFALIGDCRRFVISYYFKVLRLEALSR